MPHFRKSRHLSPLPVLAVLLVFGAAAPPALAQGGPGHRRGRGDDYPATLYVTLTVVERHEARGTIPLVEEEEVFEEIQTQEYRATIPGILNVQEDVDGKKGEGRYAFGKPSKAATGSFRLRTIETNDGEILQDLEIPAGLAEAMFVLASTDGDWLWPTAGGASIAGKQRYVTRRAYWDPNPEWHKTFPGTSGEIQSGAPFFLFTMKAEPKENFSFRISRSELQRGVASGKPFVVHGSGTWRWESRGTGAVMHWEQHTSLALAVGDIGIEAVIVPMDRAKYDEFIPEGPPLRAAGPGREPHGNQLGFSVYLRKKEDHATVVENIPWKAKVILEDPSKQPGFSMNYPDKEKADDKPDFRFEPEDNKGAELNDARTVITTGESPSQKHVIVTSWDYGAYTQVWAKVELGNGGGTLLAVYEDENGATHEQLALPRDDNGNHVADAWEKKPEVDVFARKYPAVWDGEDDPPGMARAGDGYTLYEEYRGFVVDPKDDGVSGHARFSPKKKELVVNPLGTHLGLLRQAARRYEKITKIDVHMLPGDVVLPPDDGDEGYTRWMNFNAHTDDGRDFGPRQYAVPLVGSDTDDGQGMYTKSRKGVDPHGRLLPSDVAYIRLAWDVAVEQSVTVPLRRIPSAEEVTDDMFKAAADQLAAAGMPVGDRASIAAALTARKEAATKEWFVFSAFHELGHATGGTHHGLDDYASFMTRTKKRKDIDEKEMAELIRKNCFVYFSRGDKTCPMRYWYTFSNCLPECLLYWSGKWNPIERAPFGDPWRFCGADWPKMKLRK